MHIYLRLNEITRVVIDNDFKAGLPDRPSWQIAIAVFKQIIKKRLRLANIKKRLVHYTCIQ